ncbi:MAG: thioredoxin domain-containing protein [Terriglobales bacterium]
MRKTIAFILALVGLFDSIYLLWMYLSPSIPMVCFGGGCDAVRASEYAHLLGIPTPVYGVVMYAVLAALMFWETLNENAGWTRRAVLAISAAGVAVSIWLTYLEAAVVHAWCAWCVTQALAVTLIFVLYATVQKERYAKFGFRSAPARRAWNVLMIAIAVGCVSFYFLQRAELKQAQAPPPPPATSIAERVIRPDSHVFDNVQSPVTFVEFGDLECPACAAAYPTIRDLRAQYGDRVRFVFRHYPFPQMHPFALKAAVASECAAQQGKFWQFVDRAYAANGDLAVPSLERYAGELGLDTQAFHQCLASDATLPIVERDQADGLALGVRATPTFFVGQRKIEGALSAYQFSALLAEDLSKQQKAPPISATPAPKTPAPKAASKPAAEKKSVTGAALSLSGTGTSSGFLDIKGASTDCSEDAAKGPQPTVIHTADAEKKLAAGAVFVDVRSADDYRKSHIKGAINVPLLDVDQRARDLSKQKPIVVYEGGTAAGDVCAAAKSAARVLNSRGYRAVVYQEGLKDWEKAGGAVER